MLKDKQWVIAGGNKFLPVDRLSYDSIYHRENGFATSLFCISFSVYT